MKIQFNEAQLSRPQQNSLIGILDVLQSENKNELVVTPVEFPLKLKVKLDDDVEMLLGWDVESESYSGITAKTEPEPEPDPIPESQKDTVDLPEPKPELVKSEFGQRVQALAWELAKMVKPLDSYQRGEVWIRFTETFIKEVLG